MNTMRYSLVKEVSLCKFLSSVLCVSLVVANMRRVSLLHYMLNIIMFCCITDPEKNGAMCYHGLVPLKP